MDFAVPTNTYYWLNYASDNTLSMKDAGIHLEVLISHQYSITCVCALLWTDGKDWPCSHQYISKTWLVPVKNALCSLWILRHLDKWPLSLISSPRNCEDLQRHHRQSAPMYSTIGVAVHESQQNTYNFATCTTVYKEATVRCYKNYAPQQGSYLSPINTLSSRRIYHWKYWILLTKRPLHRHFSSRGAPDLIVPAAQRVESDHSSAFYQYHTRALLAHLWLERH